MDITISVSDKIENALLKKAEATGQDIRTVVEHIIEISVEPENSVLSDAEFEKDMLLFLDDGEKFPIYDGNYSRSDLYADHD